MQSQSIFYRAVNKALNVFCHADITRVLLLHTSAFNAQEPVSTRIACHFIGMDELEELVNDVDFRISQEFIADFGKFGFLGIAARVDDRLVGMLFLVPGHVAPRHNRGGAAFKGIGLDAPVGVYYLFKVIVKPAYRGRRIHAAMMAFAVHRLSGSGLEAIVTTTDWTNFSFLKSVENMGFKRCGVAAEFVIAGRHYYQLPAQLNAKNGASPIDIAGSEVIKFRSA